MYEIQNQICRLEWAHKINSQANEQIEARVWHQIYNQVNAQIANQNRKINKIGK
jgi:hypothetical protein